MKSASSIKTRNDPKQDNTSQVSSSKKIYKGNAAREFVDLQQRNTLQILFTATVINHLYELALATKMCTKLIRKVGSTIRDEHVPCRVSDSERHLAVH